MCRALHPLFMCSGHSSNLLCDLGPGMTSPGDPGKVRLQLLCPQHLLPSPRTHSFHLCQNSTLFLESLLKQCRKWALWQALCWGWMDFIYLFDFTFQSSFRFTVKLSRKFRKFSFNSHPRQRHSLSYHQHPSLDHLICDNWWTYMDTSLAPKVHSLHKGSTRWCTLYGSGQMYDNMYPPLWNHTE